MKNKTFIILVAIFLLGATLRFWNLAKYPEDIDEDEMALGYNAYSLLHGGIDEWGHKFPLYFESGGDFKYGLYSYIDTVPVAIFGLNIFSTRSVAALAGSVSAIAVYFLVIELSKNKKLSLLSAFVLAVSPTFIHFSRIGYNNVLGTLLSTAFIIFYLKWVKRPGKKYFLFSLLFLLLSIFSYQAYRIFLPASIMLISLIYFFDTAGKSKTKIVLTGILFIGLVAASFIPASSRTRTQDFTILINSPKLTEEYNEDNLAGVPLVTTRLFHNKIIEVEMGIAARYFSYFDPSFLFVSTSENSGRQVTPNTGFMYLIEAPMFLLGILYLFKHFKSKEAWVVVAILLSSPVAASMVVEPRSTIRAVILAVPLSILVATGICQILEIKKMGRYLFAAIAILYLANVSYFLHEYFVHKTYHHPWYSDVGLSDMVNDVNKLQGGYSAVVMSHAHYMPYLFFNKINPADFIANSDFYVNPPPGLVRVKRFGKIYFNMPYDCPNAGKAGVLYVCFGTQVPRLSTVIDVIRYKDGLPAIFLIEFKGKPSIRKLPKRLSYGDSDSRFPTGVIPDSYPTLWPQN